LFLFPSNRNKCLIPVGGKDCSPHCDSGSLTQSYNLGPS
jgi:hypothetical protein